MNMKCVILYDLKATHSIFTGSVSTQQNDVCVMVWIPQVVLEDNQRELTDLRANESRLQSEAF